MSNVENPGDEFVSVQVPRRHYALVIQTLAKAMANEVAGATPTHQLPAATPTTPKEQVSYLSTGAAEAGDATGASSWSADDVRLLRRFVENPTVLALMDLTCGEPWKKVTFKAVYEHAGRSWAQARADLAGFTKLIDQHFPAKAGAWPVEAIGSSGTLVYYASPDIADAWKAQ